MYQLTIPDLVHAITHLRRLREFLPTVEHYDHNVWSYCGTPSCGLGWATVFVPGLVLLNGCPKFKPTGAGGHLAGKDAFRVSDSVAQFLFMRDYFNKLCNTIKCHRSAWDSSAATTISRLARVEQYLRRKLNALIREKTERALRLAERRIRRAERRLNVTTVC